MYKLTKFNQLYNKLIFQQTQSDQKYINSINNCDAFFRAYIEPISLKNDVVAEKQRYNIFRISGIIKSLFDFLNEFKVNKEFMDNAQQFEVLSPICTFGEIQHFYNNGTPNPIVNRTFSEGNGLIDAGNETITTRTTDDIAQRKIQGRWFNLYDNTEKNENVPDYNIPKRVRSAKPKQLIKHIQKLIKTFELDQNTFMCIEFEVNCDKLPNNSFDQLAKDVPITFSDGNKVLDISDKLNSNKTQSIAFNIKEETTEALVGDTKNIIRKTKKNDFNKKNKVNIKKK